MLHPVRRIGVPGAVVEAVRRLTVTAPDRLSGTDRKSPLAVRP